MQTKQMGYQNILIKDHLADKLPKIPYKLRKIDKRERDRGMKERPTY